MSDTWTILNLATSEGDAMDEEAVTFGGAPTTRKRERIQVTGATAEEIARVTNVQPTGSEYGLVVRSLNIDTLSSQFSTVRALSFTSGDSPIFWNQSFTGSATGALTSNENSYKISCTTANGDIAIKQTRERFLYKYGTKRRIFIGALMGAIKTNTRQRIGNFDSQNGTFFEQDGTNLKVVTRSFATGSAIDTAVNQSSWNLDKLDGTGQSGITLDTSKINTFVIEFFWSGTGYVKFGFIIGGLLIFAHQVFFENTQTTPYMARGNFPVRFELTNTGAAASSTDLKIFTINLMDDQSIEPVGIERNIDNGFYGASVDVNLTPYLSTRLTTTTLGAIFEIDKLTLTLDNIEKCVVYWQLVLNPTLTGATFSSSIASSLTEYDTAATSYTGGLILATGYTNGTEGLVFTALSKIQLSSFLGVSDIITVVLQRVIGVSTVAFISLGSKEWY